MEDRIIKLETEFEYHRRELASIRQLHEREINTLKVGLDELTKGFRDLTAIMQKIKWLLIGGLGMLLIEDIGLKQVVTKLIGGW